MKKSSPVLVSILILSAILLGACNLPTEKDTINEEATAVSLTAEAVFTHAAETAAVILPSATTAVGETAVPMTNTAAPTLPPAVTATNTPIPCNRASFVKDVTYADNTKVVAGTSFTKTWRIKNNGSCTWTSGYVLLFDSGDQMGAPATSTITSGTVTPGSTIDISVALTAPSNPGTYQGKFKLRSPDNIVFGINANGQDPFWVKIVVLAPTPAPTNTPVVTLPPPPPPLHSSGTLTIDQTYLADLDEGVVSPPAGDSDIWYSAVNFSDKYITIKNNTFIADVGVSAPTKAYCEGLNFGLVQIPLTSSLVNHYICYKTNLGRTGNFKITAYDGSKLDISYMTWE